MSVHNPNQIRAMEEVAAEGGGSNFEAWLAKHWQELSQASNAIATKAGLSEEQIPDRSAQWSIVARTFSTADKELVQQSISDAAVMTRYGLTALQNLERRGTDFMAPALALWRELHTARSAIERFVQSRIKQSPISKTTGNLSA